MEKRVVITGLGAITPVGNGKENFYNALLAGQSGIGPITHFDASEYATRIAGEVKDFDVTEFGVDKKDARRMDRSSALAIGAAVMAADDAKLALDEEDLDRCGTVVGTGIGGIDSIHDVYVTLFDKGPGRVSPFAVPMMIANMVAGRVSIRLGLRGPAITDVTACASGTNSIGDAFRIIARGDADIMFAGGTEAAISPAAVAGFAAMKAMSTRNDEPTKASRPFDKDRDGFVMGEGAGIVVLEELEHAKKRGAHIYAEVVGYGTNGDAYHITAPAPGGLQARKCMELAIKDAGIDPSEINYINAHGTSTGLNDLNETKAIKELFGDHAKDIVVNSTKSMTGHLLGAAGAIEAIVMAMAIETGKVHPTINCDNPDEGLDLDYIREGARDYKVNYALSNSFGFGGHNATLLVRRYED
ncbi:beta-ketoacyl-ACP synthase II [Veillonella sp. YH-vei2232]|uniref:3-oxoacyl-[acyl-carrier-protein] synthase 2 n=1 Tax=Veillonella absiana TaxID=3079305 RepID=A0ABU3Z8I0_9FIRM|nr:MULTISPECIES: beta-ketoacyl-ACP synthase II [unclassified Veillonella]NCB95382.1 beta-ketoacyl-[acyl-carrier-protein] synthase II [Negativicutes bacterium]MBK7921798.1 beta-ketoacyl-ACP synthase II [Veillonella sp.]MBP6923238.1 beta-ketoacyl-ACP synthase II [Veillonella sp.]MBP8617243.1 beta-ketoacyl-ACP synthase II [Veillonella sp.]MBP9517521.1 beta-ketoacyl-ACP synthase II [Veillonella sp.]